MSIISLVPEPPLIVPDCVDATLTFLRASSTLTALYPAEQIVRVVPEDSTDKRYLTVRAAGGTGQLSGAPLAWHTIAIRCYADVPKLAMQGWNTMLPLLTPQDPRLGGFRVDGCTVVAVNLESGPIPGQEIGEWHFLYGTFNLLVYEVTI